MMERRQVWLEDQFLRQEKDLLKLSRQINVIQDFITLHFDSFRDYSMERERAERRVEEISIKSNCHSRYSRPSTSSPYHTAFQNQGRRSTNCDLGESGIEDPVDLSEYPSESEPQRPLSPFSTTNEVAVDLSIASASASVAAANNEWMSQSRRCSFSMEESHNNRSNQSPSPILSGSISLPKDIGSASFQIKERSHFEAVSSDDNASPVTFSVSTSSCANHQLSPSLPSSPYDSVLSRILRSDPTPTVGLKGGLHSQVDPYGILKTEPKTSSPQFQPQLHWSSGTVTTTTPQSSYGTKIEKNFDGEDNQENSSGRDLYDFMRSLPLINTDPLIEEQYSTSVPQGKIPRRQKRSTSSKPSSSSSGSKKRKSSTGKSSLGNDQLNSSHTNAAESSASSSSGGGQGSKKCRFCGKTFQWSHSVKTHERLHTGDKPYLCKMCGTRFTQNGNLKVHAKTCVGKYAEMYKSKNIFVCPLCTEMFQSMDALMEHQRSHDRMQWSDKDKTCRYCGQVFQKRSLLLAHEIDHAKGDCTNSNSSINLNDNLNNEENDDSMDGSVSQEKYERLQE